MATGQVEAAMVATGRVATGRWWQGGSGRAAGDPAGGGGAGGDRAGGDRADGRAGRPAVSEWPGGGRGCQADAARDQSGAVSVTRHRARYSGMGGV
ncbi:hypothetical protein GCM10010521_26810 [Streptomyces rameus]|uniref:Uncharacterized protein n=1 Tax=Streptomyces rameus TaxID=68261 RepID=A0ABP6NCD7_9ACTN